LDKKKKWQEKKLKAAVLKVYKYSKGLNKTDITEQIDKLVAVVNKPMLANNQST
jgi:hypothetical protein